MSIALNTLSQLERFASAAPETLAKLRQHRAGLVKAIKALERAGLVDARPHYREGKYLYLVYPQRDGERKREYIGAEPAKVKAAFARIDRFAARAALLDQLARMDRALAALSMEVNRIDGALRTLGKAVGDN